MSVSNLLIVILLTMSSDCFIRNIVPCETFQQEVEEKLTEEEQKEVEEEERRSQLRRTNPAAYQAKMTADLAASSLKSSQHANAAPGVMPTRLKMNGPKPLTQTTGPEVSGGVADLPPFPPDISESPPGVEELPTQRLFNPGPQGFQLSAPVMSNGAVLPRQGFAQDATQFNSGTNTFTRMVAPPPQQRPDPIKYYLPNWG